MLCSYFADLDILSENPIYEYWMLELYAKLGFAREIIFVTSERHVNVLNLNFSDSMLLSSRLRWVIQEDNPSSKNRMKRKIRLIFCHKVLVRRFYVWFNLTLFHIKLKLINYNFMGRVCLNRYDTRERNKN